MLPQMMCAAHTGQQAPLHPSWCPPREWKAAFALRRMLSLEHWSADGRLLISRELQSRALSPQAVASTASSMMLGHAEAPPVPRDSACILAGL
jgi:hypothetical protein